MSPLDRKEKVRRRLDKAAGHLAAADLLAGILDTRVSHSATLLNVLSFEILLKATRLAETGTERGGSHNYSNIWNEIPCRRRNAILEAATDRNSGHVDYSDMKRLLGAWQKTFTEARYAYEVNEGRTAAEIAAKSFDWDNPDFEFFPLELDGLNFALNEWLEEFIQL